MTIVLLIIALLGMFGIGQSVHAATAVSSAAITFVAAGTDVPTGASSGMTAIGGTVGLHTIPAEHQAAVLPPTAEKKEQLFSWLGIELIFLSGLLAGNRRRRQA